MFKYKGVNFIKTVYRPYSLLQSSLFFTGFQAAASWQKFVGLKYTLKDALFIDGVYYYPEYHLQDFAQRAVRQIFKAPGNFQHLQRETLNRERAVLAKNESKDLATFFKDYLNYQPALALYHICDDLIENRLRQELLKKISPLETEQLMSQLNLPLKPNQDQLMKRWFLKTGDIAGFIKKYSWNFSRYGQHHLLSQAEARVFLKTIKKDKSFLNSDTERITTRQAVKRAKAALGRKAYYVDVMQFFVYYRTQRTDVLNKVFFGCYD